MSEEAVSHSAGGGSAISRKEAAESLRWAALVIEKMRAAVPTGGGRAKPIIGPFPEAHEPMVAAMIEALKPFVGGLETRITNHYSAPQSTKVIECKWVKA